MSEAKGMTKTMYNFEEIRNVVAENIVNILEGKQDLSNVLMEENLFNLGMDSLDYMNLIVKLEMNFGFEFEDDILDMEEYHSVNRIAAYIQKSIN